MLPAAGTAYHIPNAMMYESGGLCTRVRGVWGACGEVGAGKGAGLDVFRRPMNFLPISVGDGSHNRRRVLTACMDRDEFPSLLPKHAAMLPRGTAGAFNRVLLIRGTHWPSSARTIAKERFLPLGWEVGGSALFGLSSALPIRTGKTGNRATEKSASGGCRLDRGFNRLRLLACRA